MNTESNAAIMKMGMPNCSLQRLVSLITTYYIYASGPYIQCIQMLGHYRSPSLMILRIKINSLLPVVLKMFLAGVMTSMIDGLLIMALDILHLSAAVGTKQCSCKICIG